MCLYIRLSEVDILPVSASVCARYITHEHMHADTQATEEGCIAEQQHSLSLSQRLFRSNDVALSLLQRLVPRSVLRRAVTRARGRPFRRVRRQRQRRRRI